MLYKKDIAFKIKDKNYIKGKNSILDIGCKYGVCLYPFLDIDFTDLKGIDIMDSDNSYHCFLSFKTRGKTKKEKEFRIEDHVFNLEDERYSNSFLFRRTEFDKEYQEFSTIEWDFQCNILNYISEKKYDVVLALHLLHFFDDNSVQIILGNIKAMLAKNGIIIVAVNTPEIFLKNKKEGSYKLESGYIFKTIKSLNDYYLFTEDRINNHFKDFEIVEELDYGNTARTFVLKPII